MTVTEEPAGVSLTVSSDHCWNNGIREYEMFDQSCWFYSNADWNNRFLKVSTGCMYCIVEISKKVTTR